MTTLADKLQEIAATVRPIHADAIRQAAATIAKISKPAKPDVAVSLPFPPSINSFYRMNMKWKPGQPDRFITKEGKAWQLRAWGILDRKGFGHDKPALKGRLRVSLSIVAPDRVRRDIDNLAKVTLDTINRRRDVMDGQAVKIPLAFEDDSQIDELRIRRLAPDPYSPRIEVRAWQISKPENVCGKCQEPAMMLGTCLNCGATA